MDNETKAILSTNIKNLEQINKLRSEVVAIKEAVILLLKAQTTFPEGSSPESFMQAVTDRYLEETQPILDNLKAALKI